MSRQQHPKKPLPIWVWPFAVACFAIPVFSVGGAIPTGIGVGAGFYCLAIAREANKSTHRKLFHCGAAMAVAWTLFLAVAGGAVILRDKVFAPKVVPHQQESVAAGGPTTTVERDSRAPVPRPSRPASIPRDPGNTPLDDATRREIYAKAVSLRDDIERAVERERDFRAKGMGDVAQQQVEHIKDMHESRQEFYADFYQISRAELDAIIARGDRENWSHN